MIKKHLIILILACALAVSSVSAAGYFTYKYLSGNITQEKDKDEAKKSDSDKKTYPYTLVAHTGEVFGAKIPKNWETTDSESGIDIFDPDDNNTGSAGIVAVGWFGSHTPDSFIEYMLNAVGATAISYENESDQETITDSASNLVWVMKTKTLTFTNKEGVRIKAKVSAGVLNGYGQFCGMITAFQTTPEKWGQWAPTLERIAKSITIINPSKAGGIDTVRLPTAADLTNDSSPLMESWEYRNQAQDRSSHEWSDAIMGQETDLYSPSTGENYTRPFSAYDPTIGGYRNPDKSTEILVDPYAR
ncbi:hypothetical protein ACFL14_02830 [Patescibacteria group bacterium]